MSKTPVSLLQEMMVKKQMITDYELIHDGGGTHDNIFIYKVSCDGLSATGTGRSKKDAKHEAAKAMLQAIAAHSAYPQLPAAETKSPVKTPLPTAVPVYPKTPLNVPFMNAIGALTALCYDENLQEPEYHEISDVGPPHLRVFTIQCVVGNFKEDAAATTKKQAKHEAARKMLERIRGLTDDCENKDLYQDNEEIQKQEEEAMNLYPKLSKLYTTRNINLGLKFVECHDYLRNSYPEEVRSQLVESMRTLQQRYEKTDTYLAKIPDEMISEINEILKLLNLHVEQKTLCSKDDKIIVAVEVDCALRLVIIGSGLTKELALCKALLQLCSRLIGFLE